MFFWNIKHWTYTTFLRVGAVHSPLTGSRLFLHVSFPVWLKHPEVLTCIYNRPLPVSYQLLILRVLPLSSSCLPPIHLEEIGIRKLFSLNSDVVYLPADTSIYLLSGSHRTIVILSGCQGESLGPQPCCFTSLRYPKEITYSPKEQLGGRHKRIKTRMQQGRRWLSKASQSTQNNKQMRYTRWFNWVEIITLQVNAINAYAQTFGVNSAIPSPAEWSNGSTCSNVHNTHCSTKILFP